MLRNGRLLWSSKQNKFLVAVKPLIFLSLLSDADRLDQGSPGDFDAERGEALHRTESGSQDDWVDAYSSL